MQRKQLVFILLIKLIAASKSTKCGPNEVPDTSNCGNPCPPTCALRKPEACTAVCLMNSCVCKEGYIRSENRSSPCIPESECPKTTTCGPNEVPGPPCGSPCPPTCGVPKPKFCIEICIVNGCVCKPGYIRSENLGSPCIPKSKCPKPCNNGPPPGKCGPHEVYTKCNYTTCVGACDRLGRIFCPIQGVKCVGGCLCEKDYVRLTYKNLTSPCVPKKLCPTCNTKSGPVKSAS